MSLTFQFRITSQLTIFNFLHTCNYLNLLGADFEPIEVIPLNDWSGYSENVPIAELRVRNAVQTEKYK
jgi:hypothetical protein